MMTRGDSLNIKITDLETLNEVLAIIREYKKGQLVLEELLKRDLLHSSFEQRYILNNNDFEFHLISANSKNHNLVLFYLDALDGSPFRVEMILEEKWYLKSFLFQCQGCFGDDEECGVCGGSGWGVL